MVKCKDCKWYIIANGGTVFCAGDIQLSEMGSVLYEIEDEVLKMNGLCFDYIKKGGN